MHSFIPTLTKSSEVFLTGFLTGLLVGGIYILIITKNEPWKRIKRFFQNQTGK